MKYVLIALSLLVGATTMSFAQNDGEKAGFDPNSAGPAKLTDAPLSVIDKLIAVEQDMQRQGMSINWREIYGKVSNDVPTNMDLSDAQACVLIGFKVSDATLALKAQDAEELKRCIEAIEKLAAGLNIPEEGLQRAAQVKSAVERNDWMNVFMQLSMMRQDIGKQLESLHNNDRSRGVIMVCGAWMQAVRVAYVLVIEQGLGASATNYLRSPLFVELMQTELANITDPELKDSAQVKELREILPTVNEIVTIDRNPDIPEGQITLENMNRLRDLANQFLARQVNML